MTVTMAARESYEPAVGRHDDNEVGRDDDVRDGAALDIARRAAASPVAHALPTVVGRRRHRRRHSAVCAVLCGVAVLLFG
jgi:hypothetical protein